MVLIVEDDESTRLGLSEYLDILGYPNKTASDGQEALDLLNTTPFNIVLLDLMLPHVNGYQVLRHIKADDTLKNIPVIVISALNIKENIQHCLDLGASAFLPKPFDFADLQTYVKDAFGK